jgi:hypothetical protein
VQGKLDVAEPLFCEVMEIYERAGRTRDPVYPMCLHRLGRTLVELNRAAEAQAVYEKSRDAYIAMCPGGDWRVGYSQVLTGGAIVRQAQAREAAHDDAQLLQAESTMSNGYAQMRASRTTAQSALQYAATEMARLYEARGMPDKAAEYRAVGGTTLPSSARPAPATLPATQPVRG